jgi:hypothetical protein
MRRPKLKRPSPGTVLGLLALIVAVAGNTGAFAGSGHKVTKRDLAKGAVTAQALAAGAVRSKAIANGAVTAKKIKPGAVGSGALAADAIGPAAIKPGSVGATELASNAVTATAIAPGSIYGGALGPVALHGAPIADLDSVAENGTWTASNTETAMCAPGERLSTGGIVFTNPGNREVGVLESLPFSNETSAGVVGRITSNSGGTASAEVQAICLK